MKEEVRCPECDELMEYKFDGKPIKMENNNYRKKVYCNCGYTHYVSV